MSLPRQPPPATPDPALEAPSTHTLIVRMQD